MSLPQPGPSSGWGRSAGERGQEDTRDPVVAPPTADTAPKRTGGSGAAPTSHPHSRSRRGLPGLAVVGLATLTVVGVAVAEVMLRETVGQWTAATLVAVSGVAALVTKAGDRSLPAMMPPLAFATAALIAGQMLVDRDISDPWRRQAVMLVETLGRNAAWVVAATLLAVLISTARHVHDRRRRLRPSASGG